MATALAGLCASLLAPDAGAAILTSGTLPSGTRSAQIVLPPLPPITLPPIGLPPITVPPIDVPPIQLPGLDPIDLPPITLPPVDVSPTTSPTGDGTAAVPAGARRGRVEARRCRCPVPCPTRRAGLRTRRRSPSHTARSRQSSPTLRASVQRLLDAGAAPQLVASLQTLIDQIVDGTTAITAATVHELDALVAKLRASLTTALVPLLAPVQDLVDDLLGSIVGGVVTVPGVTPPTTSTPSTPDHDRGTGSQSPSSTSSAGNRDADDPGADTREPSSPGSGTGSPFDPIPIGSDTALFGESLLLPAPLPSPVRDDTPLAVSGALGGTTAAGSERSDQKAVLPGEGNSTSPQEARAPPSDERTLRALGCGPESRPG